MVVVLRCGVAAARWSTPVSVSCPCPSRVSEENENAILSALLRACARTSVPPVRPSTGPRDPNEEFARNEICKLSNKLITPSFSDRANATGEVDGAGDHLSRVYDEA